MSGPQFKAGDRVQARTSVSIPEGTPGSVYEVLRNVPDMCFVQFDGYDHPTLMHAADLERVEDVPPPDRQRTTAAD
jgi:hypothetical protein